MPKYETIGGQVTRGETFAKIIHLCRELQECCAVMGHLHNTEDSIKDNVLGTGWIMMSEMFKQIEKKIIMMGQGRLQ